MPWEFEQTITGSSPLVLPVVFTSGLLAIELAIADQPATWFKAGYLQAFVEIEGIPCLGRRFTLWFGGQLVEIPYASYQLQFQAVQWSELTRLRIKQLSTPEIKVIMPLYTAGQPVAAQPVLDSLPTSFTALGYLATNPAATYLALAANPARQTYAIVNLGTVTVHLDLDPPTSNTKRLVAIPANGTYVSDIPYVGNVYAWSSTVAACPIEVREFIQ